MLRIGLRHVVYFKVPPRYACSVGAKLCGCLRFASSGGRLFSLTARFPRRVQSRWGFKVFVALMPAGVGELVGVSTPARLHGPQFHPPPQKRTTPKNVMISSSCPPAVIPPPNNPKRQKQQKAQLLFHLPRRRKRGQGSKKRRHQTQPRPPLGRCFCSSPIMQQQTTTADLNPSP